jgi:hypothetical protein
MRRYSVSFLIVLALSAAFWAYTIADALIRELSKDVTFVDLAAIFTLGVISGLAVGLSFAFKNKSLQTRQIHTASE